MKKHGLQKQQIHDSLHILPCDLLFLFNTYICISDSCVRWSVLDNWPHSYPAGPEKISGLLLMCLHFWLNTLSFHRKDDIPQYQVSETLTDTSMMFPSYYNPRVKGHSKTRPLKCLSRPNIEEQMLSIKYLY